MASTEQMLLQEFLNTISCKSFIWHHDEGYPQPALIKYYQAEEL